MEFITFKKHLQKHVENMLENQDNLFVTSTDPDELWNLYLNSFPPGTNEIFRKRREHDCSCCRHFIRSFGSVVVVKDNEIISIWNFHTNNATYQPVIDKLNAYVISKNIKDVFITKEKFFGTDFNHEQLENGTVHTWNHFRIDLPKRFISNSKDTELTLTAQFRDIRNVFKRSLEEISKDSIETVLDLIAQKSLYKGDEWKNILDQFLTIHNEYQDIKEKDIYCWQKSIQVGAVIGKIKNHSIGVLLTNITKGIELNEAVHKYEVIVAPTNYKRPKEIYTKKMIEAAQKTITELGFLDSLGRRYATIDDITINNILFANKDTTKRMTGDIFSELKKEATTNQKNFDKIEEVPIENLIKDILPTTTDIEVLLENKLTPNLFSLIAPVNKESKTMFKWGNNFSWAYNGNITDSMKELVKKAGGNVEGVLRFSIQWNDNADNENDFDAHCIEPNKNEIFFRNKEEIHPSSGMLDVDIITPMGKVAVENITWTNKDKMQEGMYVLFVHNYHHVGGRSGFSAEIEYENQLYKYEYNKELRQDENIVVAKINFNKKTGITFIESLPSTTSSKTVWNLNTNNFYPVSALMYSPNYWEQKTGHKHYFFTISECINDTQPNGFFNEFLKEDLMKHKRVFSALGSKMRVEPSDNQLSGLGFSSTKHNSLVCKVKGSFTRTIKIIF